MSKMIITLTKKIDVYVSKNIQMYRLYRAWITQNKQKCLMFILIPKEKKTKVRGSKKLLDQVQKEKYPKKEDMIDDNNNDINGK